MIELAHRNENGLDYGDWANRVGLWFIARSVVIENEDDFELDAQEFRKCLDQIEVKTGIYCRYPKAPWNATFDGKWAFSRDQQTPLVIAMGAYTTELGRLYDLYELHKARFWRYQNRDWASPEHINYYNRSLGIPINKRGDWFMLANSVIIVVRSYIQPRQTSNDLNHTVALLQAMYCQPTRVSKLAHWVYRKLRKNGVQWAWSSYFQKNPPLDEVYRPILERYFSK